MANKKLEYIDLSFEPTDDILKENINVLFGIEYKKSPNKSKKKKKLIDSIIYLDDDINFNKLKKNIIEKSADDKIKMFKIFCKENKFIKNYPSHPKDIVTSGIASLFMKICCVTDATNIMTLEIDKTTFCNFFVKFLEIEKIFNAINIGPKQTINLIDLVRLFLLS